MISVAAILIIQLLHLILTRNYFLRVFNNKKNKTITFNLKIINTSNSNLYNSISSNHDNRNNYYKINRKNSQK